MARQRPVDADGAVDRLAPPANSGKESARRRWGPRNALLAPRGRAWAGVTGRVSAAALFVVVVGLVEIAPNWPAFTARAQSPLGRELALEAVSAPLSLALNFRFPDSWGALVEQMRESDWIETGSQ